MLDSASVVKLAIGLLRQANVLLTHLCVAELEQHPLRDLDSLLAAKARLTQGKLLFERYVKENKMLQGEGLADRMKLIIQRARGVLEEALEAEKREESSSSADVRTGSGSKGGKKSSRGSPGGS